VEELVQAHDVLGPREPSASGSGHRNTSMKFGYGPVQLSRLECDNRGHRETRMST
jgi:hypothetical protein